MGKIIAMSGFCFADRLSARNVKAGVNFLWKCLHVGWT